MDNVTVLDTQETATSSSDMNTLPGHVDQKQSEYVDDAFYQQFWSLQNYFSQPTRLFDKHQFTQFQQVCLFLFFYSVK